MRDNNERRLLAENGVIMLDNAVYALDGWGGDYQMALDAQPQLVTTLNQGIPAFLAQIVDPVVLEVVLQPLRIADVAGGEVMKGDWLSQSMLMPLAESAGHVVTYGDYDMGGTVDFNVEWVSRQPWHYQTIKRTGEKQIGHWGLAAIDANARMDTSVAQTFNRIRNRSYAYGVLGLQNYGILNDPSLSTPIVPNTKAGGGTSWANATAIEIYNDVLKLFTALQVQMGGNLTRNDELVLALSPEKEAALSNVSPFNVPTRTTLMENFPGLRIEPVPEYDTAAGQVMQLIVPQWDGQQTVWTAFTEKMRAHPVVQELSAWSQKFSGGTWGSIIRRPIAVKQMLGI